MGVKDDMSKAFTDEKTKMKQDSDKKELEPKLADAEKEKQDLNTKLQEASKHAFDSDAKVKDLSTQLKQTEDKSKADMASKQQEMDSVLQAKQQEVSRVEKETNDMKQKLSAFR